MTDILKLGDIYSVIRQNPDRTLDQVYMKVVPNTRKDCLKCFMHKRIDRNTSRNLCRMCARTLTETGNDVMFEYSNIKFE